MRTNIFLMMLGLLLAAGYLRAQEIPSRVNEGVSMPSKKGQKKSALEGLNLSREQLKDLQTLNKEQKALIKKVTADSAIDQKEKRKRLQGLRQQQAQKLQSILTGPQYARYQQNMKEMKAQGDEQPAPNQVTNNVEKDKSKDLNGLSRNTKKKTSKNQKGNWNDLNLTAAQRKELKLLTDDYAARLRIVRSDMSKNASEKKSQIQQIQREYNMQLGGILTAEQKVKWDERQLRARNLMSPRELQNNKQGLNGAIK
ncbi:hypothetical protein ABDK00_015485 [Niabella insulamsoli]|uniref:hypothetical protein n=1 Tax=Niabella insulamsoli TaxID=3144874 RepID=UPI0031FC03C9